MTRWLGLSGVIAIVAAPLGAAGDVLYAGPRLTGPSLALALATLAMGTSAIASRKLPRPVPVVLAVLTIALALLGRPGSLFLVGAGVVGVLAILVTCGLMVAVGPSAVTSLVLMVLYLGQLVFLLLWFALGVVHLLVLAAAGTIIVGSLRQAMTVELV